jgi:hypothetical protein
MNKGQRERLSDLADRIAEARVDIEAIQEEEQDKVDNTPENLQNTERFETLSECNDSLMEAIDYLAEAEAALEAVYSR